MRIIRSARVSSDWRGDQDSASEVDGDVRDLSVRVRDQSAYCAEDWRS